MNKVHLIHLYNRAGFGILPKDLKKTENKSIDENVNVLLKKSIAKVPLIVDISSLQELEKLPEEESKKKILAKENKKLVNKLNIYWYKQLFTSETLIHDKMRLFWTNHFVCSDKSIRRNIQYLKVIEKNSLGNFRNFVLEISKNPMMLRYLNNQQNKKAHPNENYARELMELFTLGVGHYTEKDVKESARAFTGWSAKKEEFYFRKKFHDYGEKKFMGKTGHFDGTDIIEIILNNPQCAIFISEKFYKEFVNPVPNKKHITKMADVFRKNYEISELVEYVFKSDWFYNEENIGIKIKSPVELLVSIHNIIPYQFKKERIFLYIQFNLGQKLLYPPNVAGWPGNKQWIDANTIMLRLKLTSTIVQQNQIELSEGENFEDDFEVINKKRRDKNNKLIQTSVDWKKFKKQTNKTSNTDLEKTLLGSKVIPETKELLASIYPNSTKDFCITVMSLPEFQMC